MSATSEAVIRLLNSADAVVFRDLRLGGLQESPQAFSASFEQESQMPPSEIAERLAPDPEWSWVLGAFDETNELVGIVRFRRERGAKLRHKAMLWGFYVAKSHRGQGIGRRLLQDFIGRARQIPDLLQIKLSVMVTQSTATELYRRFNFVKCGHEPRALQIEG